MIFDGHSDLLYDVTRRRLAGETRVLERRHLARLRRGGIEGLVLALWYGRGQGQTFWEGVPGAESAAHRLEIMLSCAQAELAECPWLAVVRRLEEAEAARKAGKIYAFLAVEGMEGLEGPE
ncbi:MAG: membrane dipeptidase [Dysosmobacter sp.]|nr:membrane dipeptidase [Dysosmobacter sp.]